MSVPATFFLGATQAVGIDLLNTGAPAYAILTAGNTSTTGGFLAAVAGKIGGVQGGTPVITPDSVLSLEWHGEERISDYPLMDGTFASFNKVKVPYDLRIVMTCQGLNYVQDVLQTATQLIDQALGNLGLAFGQPMDRPAFLQQLDAMLDDTNLYDVVTPDKVYKNVNLVSYNHAKRNDEGATMIIAELLFREVRIAQQTYGGGIASSSESAASPVNVGSVTGILPSASVTNAFNFSWPGSGS
jgi:hypothetical protein